MNRKEMYNMASGLQEVDELKPSKEFEEDIENYIKEKKEIDDVITMNECDKVTVKVIKLLEEDNFEYSTNYIKYIHKSLFTNIIPYSGTYRKANIVKREKILNGDTATYGEYENIAKDLKTVLEYEPKQLEDIVNMAVNLWNIHPFIEGNTRTITIFIHGYLKSLGFKVNPNYYKGNCLYLRNAFVRSNYINNYMKIKPTREYINKFYTNLTSRKKEELDNNELIIDELF